MPDVKQMVQVQLTAGATHLTCWVDTAKRFQVGDEITLKRIADETRRWTVHSISAPKAAELIHTDWQVGGIRESLARQR